jgi:hypothetical protein
MCLGDISAEGHVFDESCPKETKFVQVNDDRFNFGFIGRLDPESQCKISIKAKLLLVFNRSEVS